MTSADVVIICPEISQPFLGFATLRCLEKVPKIFSQMVVQKFADESYGTLHKKKPAEKQIQVFHRDPYNNGLLSSLYKWVVFHPLYNLT